MRSENKTSIYIDGMLALEANCSKLINITGNQTISGKPIGNYIGDTLASMRYRSAGSIQ